MADLAISQTSVRHWLAVAKNATVLAGIRSGTDTWRVSASWYWYQAALRRSAKAWTEAGEFGPFECPAGVRYLVTRDQHERALRFGGIGVL